CAIDRPMPFVPPVTSTTRPLKSSAASNPSSRSPTVPDGLSDQGFGASLGISHTIDDDGVAEIVMDNPPVNALTVAGWFELGDTVTNLGRDPRTRVVVLRAEGRGFNAGVDIKEMQSTGGFDALIGANRGCFAAFAAVYDCKVPVIAAVHGYCLGGGVGLVGNSDIVVASDDAYFGLPEVDRGAP